MKDKKNIIYIGLIAILLLIGLSLLVLYYSQNFDEDFDFVNSLGYASIEFSSEIRSGETVLTNAKANLGELKLDNDGIFTQIYTFPQVIGCLEVNDNVDQNSLLVRNSRFEVIYQSDGSNVYDYREIEIPTGQERTYKLVGNYYANRVPFSQYSRENIKGISLYVIPKKSFNPLQEGYRYNKYGSGNDCTTSENNYDAESFIPIV